MSPMSIVLGNQIIYYRAFGKHHFFKKKYCSWVANYATSYQLM